MGDFDQSRQTEPAGLVCSYRLDRVSVLVPFSRDIEKQFVFARQGEQYNL